MRLLGIVLFLFLTGCKNHRNGHLFNDCYEGEYLNRVAFPIGGLGAGMFCLEGSGAISHVSIWNRPNLLNEPFMFAAIHVKGVENGSKVIQGQSPDWKRFGLTDAVEGLRDTGWGLPRFQKASFLARFPFATVELSDEDLPLEVTLCGWSPFIPSDEDNSGLPVGALEYTFRNRSDRPVEAVFSYNSRNFMKAGAGPSSIRSTPNGFVLSQAGTPEEPFRQADFAIYTDDPQTVVNHCWFRGNWFDPITVCWNDITAGTLRQSPPLEAEAPGASLAIPFTLQPNETRTIRLSMAWYAPYSNVRKGSEPTSDEDLPIVPNSEAGSCSAEVPPASDPAGNYRPWYSSRFSGIDAVVEYWTLHYGELKTKSEQFRDAFYASTLPPEVMEAVAANLTILKSPTILRQYDGRLWGWEGCSERAGSCYGSCTHVWNYAQSIPHLFPRMERTLRESEFWVSQSKAGNQMFRTSLPIRPALHYFQAAADGQLGGIMKIYREWRISGDTEWLRTIYPAVQRSMDYCINLWDPRRMGAIEEPHHNTYDIEFWGPNGMITSFYTGALQAMTLMGGALGEDVAPYDTLLMRSKAYMETKLYDGEYFIQQIRWKDLKSSDPTKVITFHTDYSPEAFELLEQEGPKYQYGAGCLSDGVLGSWMTWVCGMPEVLEREQVISHLVSVHRYNLKKSLINHANLQRPTFAMGDEGGLLLCSWPKGGKLQLPFVYSDEVWTGIEYQVAAHLMYEGEVERGLEIVRTCRERYDGRIRNPFNEYECGAWYARAMSSYSLLEGLTGVRYDAVDQVFYIDSRIGDTFVSFLSTDGGFGNVGLRGGKPFLEVKQGEIPVKKCIVSGREVAHIDG